MWSCSSAGTTGTSHARTGSDTGGGMILAAVPACARAGRR